MYFAYFDESGDSGRTGSPSETFTLSCILVRDKDWLNALDQCISFRKFLKTRFRIPPRTELKASWLIHNKGAIRRAKLSSSARMAVYKSAMRFQKKSGVFKTFGIVIAKSKITTTKDIREIAWEYAIQRLERFGASESDNIMVITDEGNGELIKKKLRKMRRFSNPPSAFTPGQRLKRSATNIIEDPAERNSKESYFVQLADLNAYAASKRANPTSSFGIEVWDELGDSRVAAVNRVRGGLPGIVVWP